MLILKHINSFNHVKANCYHAPLCKRGCPARRLALYTAAPIKWWLLFSPSHHWSASSGFVFQALVLLELLSLLQQLAV